MNSYTEKPWLTYRNDIKDFLTLAKDRNPVYAILEVDITEVTRIFEERERQGDRSGSIIAWLLWCYGQAVKSHPEIQGIRKGNNLVVFDDVDISMMIEKTMPGGQKIPVPYIFRTIQDKSYPEVSKELQAIKDQDFSGMKKRKKSPFFRTLPAFLRIFILRKLLKDPI